MISSKIKIIYLTKPYKRHGTASYQFEFIKFLQKFFEVKIFEVHLGYLPNHKKYNHKELKLNLEKFSQDYDFLMFGHHWVGDHPYENIIPLDLGFLAEVNIKKIAVLNKEWARLPDKIKYFDSLGCSHLISHHPGVNKLIKDLSLSTKMKVIISLFGFDSEIWNVNVDHNKKRYDLFFSGTLQNPIWPNEDQALRVGIEDILFYKLGKVRLLPKYKKIYWNGWTYNKLIDFINRYKRLDIDNYIEHMGQSYVIPVTLSMGIITPRLFEVLACGSVPLVDNSKIYELINNLENHVVFFNRDLLSFKESWNEAITLAKEPRISILNKEFVFDNHTWNHRLIALEKKIETILN